MKSLLLAVFLLRVCTFASGLPYDLVPVSNLADIPDVRVKDSHGNIYSFTELFVVRTSPEGVATNIYSSHGIFRVPQMLGDYRFTSVAVGPDDKVYISASCIYSNASILGVLIIGTPDGSFFEVDIRRDMVSNGPPHVETAVDDAGNIYAIAPDGCLDKLVLTPGNTGILQSDLVPRYSFVLPDGSFQRPHDLRVSRNGRIFLKGVTRDLYPEAWLEAVAPSSVPTITLQPRSVDLSPGENATLAVEAHAVGPITYQWLRSQIPIPGATASTFVTAQPGAYRVVVTGTGGPAASDVVFVRQAGLINVSTRAAVGPGNDLAIAGFIISRDSGAPRRVLVRAVGPGLADFGVPDFLRKPELALYDAQGKLVATNTGWANSGEVSAATEAAHAFPLKVDSADAALVLDLGPGAYTAQLRGAGNTAGVALVEVYEVGPDVNRFINVSTRAKVETGAGILIGGIIPGGHNPMPLLIRAIGPGLKAFGINNALSHPVLSIYDGSGKLVAVNQGWTSGSSDQAVAVADATSRAKAFPLTPGGADSALALNLAPGAYTLQVAGQNQETGIALVEAYQVPTP